MYSTAVVRAGDENEHNFWLIFPCHIILKPGRIQEDDGGSMVELQSSSLALVFSITKNIFIHSAASLLIPFIRLSQMGNVNLILQDKFAF
jgi:hypothetical protein